jgi:hypothetical protein
MPSNKPVRHNSGVYQHKLAPFARVNGGAEEFAFVMPTTLPLISFRGSGRLAGQFEPFGSGEPIISLHPTGVPNTLPFLNNTILMQDSQEINSSGEIQPNSTETPPDN